MTIGRISNKKLNSPKSSTNHRGKSTSTAETSDGTDKLVALRELDEGKGLLLSAVLVLPPLVSASAVLVLGRANEPPRTDKHEAVVCLCSVLAPVPVPESVSVVLPGPRGG
jgi:hypothetical protein